MMSHLWALGGSEGRHGRRLRTSAACCCSPGKEEVGEGFSGGGAARICAPVPGRGDESAVELNKAAPVFEFGAPRRAPIPPPAAMIGNSPASACASLRTTAVEVLEHGRARQAALFVAVRDCTLSRAIVVVWRSRRRCGARLSASTMPPARRRVGCDLRIERDVLMLLEVGVCCRLEAQLKSSSWTRQLAQVLVCRDARRQFVVLPP